MIVISREGPDVTAAELYNILRLRADIFVVEQECAFSEIDGVDLDPTTTHLWSSDDEGIRAYVRVIATGIPGTLRVGRVVTRSDCRGQGLSGTMLEAAHGFTAGSATLLDAQKHLVPFYKRFGYVQDGEDFLEDGIPHAPMKRATS